MIGIMGAMPEEIRHLIPHIQDVRQQESGMRVYYQGTLLGTPVVLVFSRMGKVAAATTATNLILEYGVEEIIFTGVAGALHPDLRIGDVVVGRHMYQHDMDATPIMSRFEIPLLSRHYFETSQVQTERALQAAKRFFDRFEQYISESDRARFHIDKPEIVLGDIASGDVFVSEQAHKHSIHYSLPTVQCVEMEGAAVAQVCYEFGIPCTVIRTISDAANESSEVDFPRFIETIASNYSEGIVLEWFQHRNESR